MSGVALFTGCDCEAEAESSDSGVCGVGGRRAAALWDGLEDARGTRGARVVGGARGVRVDGVCPPVTSQAVFDFGR